MSDPEAVVEGEATAEVVPPEPFDPSTHTAPGLILGIQAILGTCWWIISMFAYLKNASTDANLQNLAGYDTIAIGWWWERLVEASGKYVWLSASLLMTFITYFVVSVIELIAWVYYKFGQYDLARFYFSTIGYWGSLVAYFIPPFFGVIHMVD